MSTLLLRLAGPMQSWGTCSRFGHRDTGLDPSRSGVVGLLCAALGRPREAPLDDFLPLRMAVRVDREGRVMREYQTAENCRKADGTMPPWGKRILPSERYYLSDADFLVGLAGDPEFLARMDAALRQPKWPFYLGRKSFVPSLPVAEGMATGELFDVLRRWPWRKRTAREPSPTDRLRYVIEAGFGEGEPRPDVPVSFASNDRRFGVRHVTTAFHPLPPEQVIEPAEVCRVPEPTATQPA